MDVDELSIRLGKWSNGTGPLYRRLAEAFERLVRQGDVHHGDRLPPERALAAALAVSRGTIVSAYDELQKRQLVERVQGRGTTVTLRDVVLPGRQQSEDLLAESGETLNMSLSVGLPTPEMLAMADRVKLSDHPREAESHHPEGLLSLRSKIAEDITSDGLPTTADQVMVTTGGQQAMALLLTVLSKTGDVVLVEEPTWPGLTDLIRHLGAQPVGVAMDDLGLIPEALEEAIKRFRPAAIFINPHNHNPTGTQMIESRRHAVSDLAADYATPLVEDRVFARLNFRGQSPAPLAARNQHSAIYIADSLDKLAWCGLRVGWIRADRDVIASLRVVRHLGDFMTSPMTQLVTLELLRNYDRCLELRMEQLNNSKAALAQALVRQLPEWTYREPDGGMWLWARLPASVTSASAFAQHARRFGVTVGGSSQFKVSSAEDQHIRLPFSESPAHVVEGVRRLSNAWRDCPSTPSLRHIDSPVV